MGVAVIVMFALVLDSGLGEPRRFHPVVIFGRLAQIVEGLIYRDSRLHGIIADLGILTRLFAKPSSLRIGLPGVRNDWEKLAAALAKVTNANKTKITP